MKKAIIIGILSREGFLLTRFLLKRGYAVHGIVERSGIFDTITLETFTKEVGELSSNLVIHYGDLTDLGNVSKTIYKIEPIEIYNLGLHNRNSLQLDVPDFTTDINALGTLRILESIRVVNSEIRFYQLSPSNLYDKIQSIYNNKTLPDYTKKPYKISNAYAYWIVISYRETYGLFACNGIFINLKSSFNGVSYIERIEYFSESIWSTLQQNKPNDYFVKVDNTYNFNYFSITNFVS